MQQYNEFVDKFKPRHTSDDTHTPPNVYEAVLSWAERRYGIDRAKVVRPFFPGGDYEHADYPADCIVLDNPPFSILAQIVRFYLGRGIPFFLFAPSLFPAVRIDVLPSRRRRDLQQQRHHIRQRRGRAVRLPDKPRTLRRAGRLRARPRRRDRGLRAR